MGNSQSSVSIGPDVNTKRHDDAKNKLSGTAEFLNTEKLSGCPMKHGKSPIGNTAPDTEYINPRNLMPEISQDIGSDQTSLSTERMVSSIPKCGSSCDSEVQEKWVYPSSRQFNNALKRKGKEVQEENVHVMVVVHNFINENSWKEIMKWEKLFHCDCKNLSLDKFRGRPNTMSPLAVFNHYVMGSDKPFDRHDWTIDRCGRKVRYVLDYYSGRFSDDGDTAEFAVVARPALDSFSSAWDLIRMGTMTMCEHIKNKINGNSAPEN